MTDGKANHPIATDHVVSGDRVVLPLRGLEDVGTELDKLLTRGVPRPEIALSVDPRLAGSQDAQADASQARARVDQPAVFDAPARPLVEQINTGVEVMILDAAEGGHVRVPVTRIVAEEIVRFAGEPPLTNEAYMGTGAQELQTGDCFPGIRALGWRTTRPTKDVCVIFRSEEHTSE